MTVASILEEAFVGDPFPGHDRIHHTLADLQVIVSQRRPEWRIALEHMKGVYIIHDQAAESRVVPSDPALSKPPGRRAPVAATQWPAVIQT